MKGSDFNRFTVNPVSVDIPRARFERPNRWLGSFNAGDLIPVYLDEVLPGDTFSVDTACVVRMTTPIHPVMDNANLDIYYFFIPNRLVWEHWREFMGQADPNAYSSPVEYTVPQITFPQGVKKGSVADMFGLPVGVNGISVSALPFRAYALVWNEWFRDQNTMNPVNIPLGDATVVCSLSEGNAISDADYFNAYVLYGAEGDFPLRVAKYHDYFTSALPQPQKGEAVSINLGGEYPVVGLESLHSTVNPYRFLNNAGLGTTAGYNPLYVRNQNGTTQDGELYVGAGQASPSVLGLAIESNLGVDLSEAGVISINMLRQAFQLQKLFERDARGGTRYTEIIKAHFGVTSPDSRQQRPEYLGGKRIPITMSQVLQTSATNDISPQGNTAAYSLTQDASSSFTKSFTEHGIVLGLACVRTDHTYQQGIDRMWSRKSKYDFYDPVFANIGEQAILNKEIYAQGTAVDEEGFGFQEAWAEYRYKPSRVTGALRSTYAQSLDVWHYGDDFDSLPTLSPQFITATKKNVDRTLAVSSSVEDQFIADFYFKNVCVRPMPLYSIPGLIDHH